MKKLMVFLVACAVFLGLAYVFGVATIKVTGTSMEPTIPNQARIVGYNTSVINRFDVVTFIAPDDEDANYIKRIIGLPGDLVEVDSGELFISGEKISEAFLHPDTETENFVLYDVCGQITVPPDYYFVLGDNRSASNDSRRFGFVPKANIEKKVGFILWPLANLGHFSEK